MKVKTEDYPFLRGIVSVPKERNEDVASIRGWLKHQPHLPQNLTDAHIMLFLHSNYYSLEKTKTTIENYYVIKAETPEMFTNWNMGEFEESFTIYEMASVPGKTPEGYTILLYRLKDFDPSKVSVDKGLRLFLAFEDVRISEDGLSPGYVVIFDTKGSTLGHLARVTAQLHFVRTFLVYIQDCHPVRLKGIHVINTTPMIDRVLSMMKPFLHSELLHLLHLHTSINTLSEFVPLNLLPEDYNGDAKSYAQLHEEHIQLIKKFYIDWLLDSEKWCANLKKKPQQKKGDMVGDMVGSFRSLQID